MLFLREIYQGINLASCSLKDTFYSIPVYMVQIDLIQSPGSRIEYKIQVCTIIVLCPLLHSSLNYSLIQEWAGTQGCSNSP